MEIRQIRYFVAVIDCGSLSQAARQVHVAQSALSKQMSALEDELGVQLFHRSHNGVVASEAGKVFYEYAQGMLKHLLDARAAVTSSPDAVSGSIIVALPQSVATILAMPLMRAVAARYPQVAFHLNEELTGNVMDQLIRGRVDLALFSSADLPAQVLFSALIEEDFYLIHRANAPDAPPAGDVSLEQALARPLVFPSQAHGHSTRTLVEQAVAQHGLTVGEIAMEVNSVHILKSAVEAGIGHTIMPLNLAMREIEDGRLVAHRVAAEGVSRTLGICSCASMPASQLKTLISELIREVVRDMCACGDWPGGRAL
ncbi:MULTISPECIES: LysR family transcriptional regulator [Pseudomonas]|jgi:LysR family nitrogen assimilation transcriptional regulator|uniref:LysR family transcriptional regulator n=1 Tax=Pseudomonas TaxID=286 RepID=UPI00042751A9|nr:MULTISPECIES: LysR substrate-binding domain-containing protein [Pseudomonas]MCW2270747.1 LysR family nitrogen assimilation transcriptional regulator [Pseudomonas sp. JUb96]PRA59629.1 LysR family transcriptional regulator [Pseudomonas sp. MYb187]